MKYRNGMSKKCFILASLWIFSALAFTTNNLADAQAAEICVGLSTSADIEKCFAAEILSSASKLNHAIVVASKMGDKQHLEYLSASQKSWMSYQKSECEFEQDTMRGGTFGMYQGAICTIQKNINRTKELENDAELAAH
jgi:uncharacterized protein YecT (DUF1311 family)